MAKNRIWHVSKLTDQNKTKHQLEINDDLSSSTIMRELSFVKKLKFPFSGSVTKRALVIGDADNDRQNELVCANLQGDLVIFKGQDCNPYRSASGLGMITACIIGDAFNRGKNFVVIINMEGWLFVFDVLQDKEECSAHQTNQSVHSNQDATDNPKPTTNVDCASAVKANTNCDNSKKLCLNYEQRMPANCKELLLADLDGDGHNELIIGLTDRVLRTYKWIDLGEGSGKFVGLYKWEFADQIGSVSLNPSRRENCLDIIVAQPGGTYARLECFDKKPSAGSIEPKTSSSSGDSQDRAKSIFSFSSDDLTKGTAQAKEDDPKLRSAGDDEVKTEYISKLTPEYHQLAIAQMRNHRISTELLGGLRSGKGSNSYTSIVIATLDGTLMLVNKDEILWSLQVDHQLFALSVIEQDVRKDTAIKNQQGKSLVQSISTCTIAPNKHIDNQTPVKNNEDEDNHSQSSYSVKQSSQYFVVCAWNGKTYIVDEEHNYIRFKFEEAVSAFTAGSYFFDGKDHPVLVYATFNNQIILYYDVVSDCIKPNFLLQEIMTDPKYSSLRDDLELLYDRLNYKDRRQQDSFDDHSAQKFYGLIRDILYKYSPE